MASAPMLGLELAELNLSRSLAVLLLVEEVLLLELGLFSGVSPGSMTT